MSLHHVSYLVPSKTTAKNKTTWTPTILESQEAFFKSVKNQELLLNEMKKRKKVCDFKGIQDHPMIFEVSSGKDTKYCVALCETIYECKDLIQAVEASFKIFAMLKIPFPPECEKVWFFVNEIFFKVKFEKKPNFKLLSNLNYLEF